MNRKQTIVLAPDSFKESLSSLKVCEKLKEGITEKSPQLEVLISPIADGGEGTVETLLTLPGAKKYSDHVTGPLRTIVTSTWGMIENKDSIAIIEMASAAGLPQVPAGKRDPMITTTYGLGELIIHAVQAGAGKIIVGLGGSATNDGGTGMLQALGFLLLDEDGRQIPKGNQGLAHLTTIDDSYVEPEFLLARYIAASDVRNPLYGADGASFVYGPQKGASPQVVETMDRNMSHYAEVVEKWCGSDWSHHPGSGAAGGLGFAFLAFLNAELRSGFEVITGLTGLEEKIKLADWVVTGEGKLDNQTLHGKGPYGVAEMASKYEKPVIAIGGLIDPDSQTDLDKVFAKIYRISPPGTSKEDSIRNAEEYLTETGRKIARYISGVE